MCALQTRPVGAKHDWSGAVRRAAGPGHASPWARLGATAAAHVAHVTPRHPSALAHRPSAGWVAPQGQGHADISPLCLSRQPISRRCFAVARVPPLPKTGLAALVERFGSIQVEIDGNLLNLHLAPFGLLVCGSAACLSHMEPAPAEAQISPPAQVTSPATSGLPCRLWLDRPAHGSRRPAVQRPAFNGPLRGLTRWRRSSTS